MRPQSIPMSWAVRQSAGAVASGLAQSLLFERSSIEPRHGDDRDEISPAQFVLLCMNTAFGVEDGVHGLGRRPMHAHYSAMGLRVMLGSLTLESGLQAVARLYSMASPAVRLHLRTEHDEASLIVECDSTTRDQSVFLEDNNLSWMFMHCGQFLGRPLPLTSVTTRDPAHISLGGSHYAMKAPVRLGSLSELRFPKALLAAKRGSSSTDSTFWDCMRPWLDFIEADDVAQTRGMRDANTAFLRLDVLARQTHVSIATMRRRMTSEGGMRRMRRDALVSAGITLLRESNASVDAIAERLGYADAGSFRRFLKAATGKTPQDIRRESMARSDASPPAGTIRDRIRRLCLDMDRL